MSKEAMKLALGKIKSARDCHQNAVDTLLFEAEEVLEEALNAPLLEEIAYYTSPPAQRKPLTDEEIESINVRLAGNRDLARLFARAIEAAHGIKGDA